MVSSKPQTAELQQQQQQQEITNPPSLFWQFSSLPIKSGVFIQVKLIQHKHCPTPFSDFL